MYACFVCFCLGSSGFYLLIRIFVPFARTSRVCFCLVLFASSCYALCFASLFSCVIVCFVGWTVCFPCTFFLASSLFLPVLILLLLFCRPPPLPNSNSNTPHFIYHPLPLSHSLPHRVFLALLSFRSFLPFFFSPSAYIYFFLPFCSSFHPS